MSRTPDEIVQAVIDGFANSDSAQCNDLVEFVRNHRHNELFEKDALDDESLTILDAALDDFVETATLMKKFLAEQRTL